MEIVSYFSIDLKVAMSVAKLVCLHIGFLILVEFVDKTKPLDLKFQQNDYEMEFQRVELESINKLYTKFYKIVTFKYNRTTPLVNITYEYKINVGNDAEIILQAYVFLSNEYRHFPIRFQFNFCEAVRQNSFGAGALSKCGNFTGCPLQKGRIYQYCNWAPDPSQFPPFIPNGDYMLQLTGIYHGAELYVMNAYGRVRRPFRGN